MEAKVCTLIIGMWLVNYLPRMIPMVVLSKIEIPPIILTWLEFVPAAVLASLLVPNLVIPGKVIDLTLQNKYLLSAIPAFAVAIKTRSLTWTLVVGIAAMALLQNLL